MNAMKKTMKVMSGVTLLEIMLVLAIAAMIIVMSIRYYQSASASQQANQVMEQIQAISAAADSLSQATGTYSGITTSTIAPLLGTNGLALPWGGTLAYAYSSPGYTITLGSVPASVCALLQARVVINKHFTASGGCGALAFVFKPNI